VRPEIGYTFATGLRTTLRQDPNVIMVGEIRDSETANLAVQAALTGHLVLSTIHTNNCSRYYPAPFDMGVEPYLIPPVLILGMAQRLVKTLCLVAAKK
jgi:type IV pilus assembly protein PilB